MDNQESCETKIENIQASRERRRLDERNEANDESGDSNGVQQSPSKKLSSHLPGTQRRSEPPDPAKYHEDFDPTDDCHKKHVDDAKTKEEPNEDENERDPFVRDRLSFMRFLGLGLEGRVPDAKTVWLYREQLTQAGVIEALFETFDGYLKDQGYLAMGGQIIDASIVAVPKQRNSREENALAPKPLA